MPEFDVVVIGSGPGGATAADVLTGAGKSVCILEKGRNHLLALEHPYASLGHLSNDEIVAQLQAIGPNAVKGRWRTPLPMRYMPIPFGPPIGWVGLRYLLDVGFTRDVWAHRIDLHQAIGRPMHLTADHDGRLVADIVAEWAEIHGQRFELVLEGPAGGKFTQGVDGERVEIDALDFIRTLSGRLTGTGVLSNALPL